MTAAILIPCLLLWILEKQTDISSATTAMIGGAMVYMAVDTWFMLYQNTIYLAVWDVPPIIYITC